MQNINRGLKKTATCSTIKIVNKTTKEAFDTLIKYIITKYKKNEHISLSNLKDWKKNHMKPPKRFTLLIEETSDIEITYAFLPAIISYYINNLLPSSEEIDKAKTAIEFVKSRPDNQKMINFSSVPKTNTSKSTPSDPISLHTRTAHEQTENPALVTSKKPIDEDKQLITRRNTLPSGSKSSGDYYNSDEENESLMIELTESLLKDQEFSLNKLIEDNILVKRPILTSKEEDPSTSYESNTSNTEPTDTDKEPSLTKGRPASHETINTLMQRTPQPTSTNAQNLTKHTELSYNNNINTVTEFIRTTDYNSYSDLPRPTDTEINNQMNITNTPQFMKTGTEPNENLDAFLLRTLPTLANAQVRFNTKHNEQSSEATKAYDYNKLKSYSDKPEPTDSETYKQMNTINGPSPTKMGPTPHENGDVLLPRPLPAHTAVQSRVDTISSVHLKEQTSTESGTSLESTPNVNTLKFASSKKMNSHNNTNSDMPLQILYTNLFTKTQKIINHIRVLIIHIAADSTPKALDRRCFPQPLLNKDERLTNKIDSIIRNTQRSILTVTLEHLKEKKVELEKELLRLQPSLSLQERNYIHQYIMKEQDEPSNKALEKCEKRTIRAALTKNKRDRHFDTDDSSYSSQENDSSFKKSPTNKNKRFKNSMKTIEKNSVTPSQDAKKNSVTFDLSKNSTKTFLIKMKNPTHIIKLIYDQKNHLTCLKDLTHPKEHQRKS